MKSDFYFTLPSNSSLTDFPNNSSNDFKVRLPRPIRLQGNWRVALATISVPDPKNALPSWLTNNVPLVTMSWYNADTSHLNKQFLAASFHMSDLNHYVDMTMITGIEFMRNVFHYFEKKRYFEDSRTGRFMAGQTPIKSIIPQ